MRQHRRRHAASGFTMVELMVTVVIIAILAAVSAPLLSRNRDEDRMRGFVGSFATDIRRSKFQAVGTRLPIHAHIFSDRIEFRESTALDGGGGITAPVLATPPLRILRAPQGVVIQNVTSDNSAIPPLGVLSPATFIEMQFDGMGRVRRLDGGGLPIDQPTFIWIENTKVDDQHPYARLRLDVSPLTGIVQERGRWDSI